MESSQKCNGLLDYSPILLSMNPDLNRNLSSTILPTKQWLYAYHAKKLLFLKANIAPQFNLSVQKQNMSTSPPMVRYWSPYNMPWKPRGGSTGTILLSHKFGAKRGWVVNVTLRPLCLRERDLAPTVAGGRVDRWPSSPSPLCWWTWSFFQLTDDTISSHGRHWASKETRPGRQATVIITSAECHADSEVNYCEHKC